MQNEFFPRGFVWGASTSAYQVEGGASADGKGPSIWDTFCRRPGAVWRGQTGDQACDHYHRWPEDVRLMERIGLQAYRFSVSWPRVLPEGRGRPNPAGLDFYSRLVDTLLAAGIQPYLTLFHWDYPEALYQAGGWLHSDSPHWFAEYAALLATHLSDRVVHWMTLNEPQVYTGMGLHWGHHAPGCRVDQSEMLCAMHNSLLAHGLAVQAIRAGARRPVQVGFASAAQICIPATPDPADVEAARAKMFSVTPDSYIWNNTWFSDPLFFRQYPADGLALFAPDLPAIRPDDMETIAQPLDFYAFNTYSGSVIQAGENGQPRIIAYPDGHPTMMNRWDINPEILYWGPRFFWERYRLPLYITENGLANMDWVAQDGRVHDPQRIDYLARHLQALRKAVSQGVDVRGYFHWSLLDNFEWTEGYAMRFGLVYVDFPTQQRVLKDSAGWYREVILSNGAFE
jgi:beta-glucosidase